MYRVVYNLKQRKIKVYRVLEEPFVELVFEKEVDPTKCNLEILVQTIREILNAIGGSDDDM